MSLSTDHQMPRLQMSGLPKRLPVGSVYVVEGRVGQHGRLRVSSRYVVMPSGERVTIPVELAHTQPEARRHFGRHTQPGSRTKATARATKKFALVAGTRCQTQR